MAIQFLTDVNADSGTLYVDSINDRVGIGTTSPSKLLTLEGASTPCIQITDTTTPVTLNISAANSRANVGTVTSHPLRFLTDDTERMRILGSSGNVGIGTTSPSRALQVIGTDGAAKFYYNSSFTNAQYSVIDVGMMTSGTAANGFGPKITFRMGGNGFDGFAAGTIGTIRNGADNSHNLNFGTSSNGNMSTKMTITNIGQVGIGVTSPAAGLDVFTGGTAGNFYSSQSIGLQVRGGANAQNIAKFLNSSGSTVVTLDTNGRLGIGTTSPNTPLEVFNNNDQAAKLRLGTSTADGSSVAGEISFAFDGSTVGGKIESVINNDEDGADFKFYTGGANPVVTITGSDIDFNSYTSTSVSTTGPINANQNQQAPSQDTLAALCVDPSGNVVRGEQEATFTFTLAQLNSTLGQTLISAPGADKAVVITYTDWMMKYSSTGTTSNNLEIRQANLAQANASVSVLPALRFNEIVNQSQSGSAPFYGFYTRDIPTGSGSQGRTYAVNKATTIHKQNAGTYPAGLTSVSIKIRYRIFDVDTF